MHQVIGSIPLQLIYTSTDKLVWVTILWIIFFYWLSRDDWLVRLVAEHLISQFQQCIYAHGRCHKQTQKGWNKFSEFSVTPTFSEVSAWTEYTVRHIAWQQVTRNVTVDCRLIHIVRPSTTEHTSTLHTARTVVTIIRLIITVPIKQEFRFSHHQCKFPLFDSLLMPSKHFY